ncbi:hypothetical protein [Brochothrix thermosphacta]|uniref:hypothetical protein n=1 Tax=Brochothrix thermosphacta TaxID=2756 RepID=UPI00159EF5DF|nr:hypothetical protein [Brochothrix thermosphacta]
MEMLEGVSFNSYSYSLNKDIGQMAGEKSPVVDNDKMRCPLIALKRSSKKWRVLFVGHV